MNSLCHSYVPEVYGPSVIAWRIACQFGPVLLVGKVDTIVVVQLWPKRTCVCDFGTIWRSVGNEIGKKCGMESLQSVILGRENAPVLAKEINQILHMVWCLLGCCAESAHG